MMQQQDLQMPQRMQQPEQQKRDFAKEDVVRRIQREYTSGRQISICMRFASKMRTST